MVVVVWGLPYLRYWIPCAIQPPVAAAAVPAPTSQPARSVVGAVTWPAGRLLVVSTPDPAGRDRRLWAAPFARTRVLPVPWLWQSGGRAPRFCFCRPQGGGGGGGAGGFLSVGPHMRWRSPPHYRRSFVLFLLPTVLPPSCGGAGEQASCEPQPSTTLHRRPQLRAGVFVVRARRPVALGGRGGGRCEEAWHVLLRVCVEAAALVVVAVAAETAAVGAAVVVTVSGRAVKQ